MQPVSEGLVYVVDDDAGVRDALAWLLRSRRLLSETYPHAEAFLAKMSPTFAPDQPSCLLLDVRMPGMSGLALFEQLTQWELTSVLPVIFLTGHGDVPTAVDAVKRGAFDFCPKPFSDNALVDRVVQALTHSGDQLAQRRAIARLQHRVADLTDRERDVMNCVVEGLPNKLIADRLNISVRTVEVHRARVFDKMEVKSAVELANLLRKP
jgi:two-component system response regulator DctR